MPMVKGHKPNRVPKAETGRMIIMMKAILRMRSAPFDTVALLLSVVDDIVIHSVY